MPSKPDGPDRLANPDAAEPPGPAARLEPSREDVEDARPQPLDDDDRAPEALRDLVRRRSAARARRHWATADALRAEIEAAGWKPLDRGTHTSLRRAVAPDRIADGLVRYGTSAAVPSRLADPPTAAWTVAIAAGSDPEALARLLAGLRRHAPAGTQVVVAADDPSREMDERLRPGAPDLAPIAGLALEVVRTSVPIGAAGARNAALRRAVGELVVLADPSVRPTGDAFAPLAAALADPAVALAGPFGLASTDLRHFAPAAGPEAVAIEGCWLAFRRSDYAGLGPLDERFLEAAYLDAWWSAVLRVGATGTGPEPPPLRRSVVVPLPLERDPGPGVTLAAQAARSARRQFYRLLDRLRDRPDLAVTPATGSTPP